MTKKANNDFYDAAFNYISTTATRMTACSAAPADYAGIAAVELATVVMSNPDFSVSDGDVSGRKVTVGAKSNVTIDNSGSATHVVLHDGSANLCYVTECETRTLTAGDDVNFPSWKIEIQAPQ